VTPRDKNEDAHRFKIFLIPCAHFEAAPHALLFFLSTPPVLQFLLSVKNIYFFYRLFNTINKK
jgi:hypothetical protein